MGTGLFQPVNHSPGRTCTAAFVLFSCLAVKSFSIDLKYSSAIRSRTLLNKEEKKTESIKYYRINPYVKFRTELNPSLLTDRNFRVDIYNSEISASLAD